MTPAEMWKAAEAAAKALEGMPGAYVHLGACMPTETLFGLARAAGEVLKTNLYLDSDDRPYAIDSLSVVRSGVEICAQGRRPATIADAEALIAMRSRPYEYATKEEVRAKLEAKS